MEIKQLEIFACVAKKLSFSKVAEEMFVSQPTVSTQINALEKAVGVQLFVRNTKGVILTKSGADFLSYAEKILTLRDQALARICPDDTDITGEIDIISSTIPAQHLLPERIASFQKQRPGIILRVEQADSSRVVSTMSGFKYDFGMIGTTPDEGRFHSCPIYDDELILVLPKDFPHSAEAIQESFPETITSAPFIMREAGSGTRAEIEGLLSRIGVDFRKLHIPAYFADTHSIVEAVAHGMGIALVSKIAAQMYVQAGLVQAVEMKSKIFTRKIHLIYNKERWLSPVQQAFLDHMCEISRM
ncbi:MAG: selenium metabolism-associated LysR family transcriptional regulator [Oscillospiraceae bacterium]|nr:selenium metabolism-associated LysR family transcriptional regulator [Oscillospiraceae bacterium]